MVFVIHAPASIEEVLLKSVTAIGYECDSLIRNICSEKQVEIFTQWNEMNDEIL